MKREMRGKRSAAVVAYALGGLAVTLPFAASAQTATASNPLSIAQPSSDTISDIFVGKGSRGPYILNWKGIAADSETITLSGKKLMKGKDYSIDYASGSIAFTDNLPKQAIARITYKILPGKSSANTGGAINLPLSMQLLDKDRASLNVMGFYRGSGSSAPSQGLVGLAGGVKVGSGTDITSAFYISQNDDGKGGPAPDSSDRSAMKLGVTNTTGDLSFKASFMRTGSNVIGGNEYGLQPGKQLMDIASSYGKVNGPVYASFSYNQQEAVAGGKVASVNENLNGRLVVNLASSSRLSYTHSAVDTSVAGKTSTTSITDAIQLEQKLGDKSSATALVQKSQTGTGQNADNVDTTALSFLSNAINHVQLQGNWTRKDSSKTGEDTAMSVGMKVAASKNLSAEASYANSISEKNGELTSMSFGMKGAVSARLSAEANYTASESDKTGQQTATAVRFAAKPLDTMQLTGGMSWKSSDKLGDESTLDMAMNLNPNKKVSATLAHSQTTSDAAGGDQSTTSIKVAATPMDNVTVQTNLVSSSSEKNGDSTAVDASMKAGIGKVANVEAGYSQMVSDKTGTKSSASFKVATTPLSGLILTSAYNSQQSSAGGDTSSINFGMKATGKKGSVDASYVGASSDKTGDETSFKLGVSAKPVQMVGIDVNMVGKQSDKTGDLINTTAKLVVKPITYTDITVDYANQLSTANGEQTAAGVKIAATPLNNVRIEAAASEKTSSKSTADELNKSVRMEAKPFEMVKLGAGMSEQEIGDTEKTATDARIELTPSKRLTLSHAYWTSTVGETNSVIKDYSGKMKPFDFFEIAGGYKTRETTAADDVNTSTVRIALDPSKRVKLNGQYSINPEDKNGAVQRMLCKSFGVSMNMGIVGLTGAYSENNQYLAGRTDAVTEVGLNVKMFGNGQLNTKYKVASTLGIKTDAAETYSLGYTHIVGSSFSVSVSGEMTRTGIYAGTPVENYRADAKVGIKW